MLRFVVESKTVGNNNNSLKVNNNIINNKLEDKDNNNENNETNTTHQRPSHSIDNNHDKHTKDNNHNFKTYQNNYENIHDNNINNDNTNNTNNTHITSHSLNKNTKHDINNSNTTTNIQSNNKSQKALYSSIYNKNNKYNWKNILSDTNNHAHNSRYNKNSSIEIINNSFIKQTHNNKNNNIHSNTISNKTTYNNNNNNNSNNNNTPIPAFLKSRPRRRQKLAQSRELIKLIHKRSLSIDATPHHTDATPHHTDATPHHIEQRNNSDNFGNNTSYDDIFPVGYRWSLRSISSFGGGLGGLSASTATSCSSIFTDLEVFTDQMMDLCYDDDELRQLEKINRENIQKSNHNSMHTKDLKQDDNNVKNKRESQTCSSHNKDPSRVASDGSPRDLLKNPSNPLKPDSCSRMNVSEGCEDAKADENNNDLHCINRNYNNSNDLYKNNHGNNNRNYNDNKRSRYTEKHDDNHNTNLQKLNNNNTDNQNNDFQNNNSRNYNNTRVIKLTKRKDKKKLGFTVVGGCEGSLGWVDVHVKAILSDGLAAENEALKKGDRLISINDIPLTNSAHLEVVEAIKKIARECRKVELTVADAQPLKYFTKKKNNSQETKNVKLTEKEEHEKEKGKNNKYKKNQNMIDKSFTVQQADLADISLFTEKCQLLTCELRENEIKKRNSLESSEENEVSTSHHDSSSGNDCCDGSVNDQFYALEERKKDEEVDYNSYTKPHEEQLCGLSLNSNSDNSMRLTTPPLPISSPLLSPHLSLWSSSPISPFAISKEANISENEFRNSSDGIKNLDGLTHCNFRQFEEMRQNGWLIEEC